MDLLYGERLRRAREITRARHHLQAALAAFEELGASAWAERAAAELAATAPRLRREADPEDQLSAQELQVAELAAAGLTNKQIGARLYLSPRTVSAHLYRIFPKLGITSRAALRDALSRAGIQPAGGVATAASLRGASVGFQRQQSDYCALLGAAGAD